ncbi:(d)CMP kinase [Occultella glacieicola]|uniref:Cytidylate kinase n=1 Tax=Occultella glacieicola TaxID=2518684 RepID=A0ABY2DZQ4_9MICO|nr:(d)CMP kinase [Occultella glacieicola]TDE88128.1 (d)CMP kinase [Occultella glacieicola]
MTALVVAIDGPSGTGKSTISRRVAADFGLAYLDTGAMYRAAAWWCVREGIDLADTAAVAAQVRELPLEIGTDPREPSFAVGGEDVSVVIRSTEISTLVSAVATNLDVRAELQDRQRAAIAAERGPGGFSGGRGIVAEGRDITTVVAPEAQVRILLLADETARLARRAKELHGTVDDAALEATRDQVVRRDADDSTVSNFTTAADGVITVDTSAMTLEESVDTVRTLVSRALATNEEEAR